MFSYSFQVVQVDVLIGGTYMPAQVIYSNKGVTLAIGSPPTITLSLERILGRVDEDGIYDLYGHGFGAIYKMRHRPDRSISVATRQNTERG